MVELQDIYRILLIQPNFTGFYRITGYLGGMTWFPVIFRDFPWFSRDLPWFSHDFPLFPVIFRWFPVIFRDFPWFPVIFRDVPLIFRVTRFPVISHDIPWFSCDFPWFSRDFPVMSRDFPWFCRDVPCFPVTSRDIPWFSRGTGNHGKSREITGCHLGGGPLIIQRGEGFLGVGWLDCPQNWFIPLSHQCRGSYGAFFWIFQFSADFLDFLGGILSFFQKSTKISSKKSQKSAENGNFQKRLHRILHTDGIKV